MLLPFLIILTFLRLKKFRWIFENYVKHTLANLDLHLIIQADLTLLDFALLHFSNAAFFQHKSKACGKPMWSESISAFCCCLVAQLCLTLCDPMDCSMPGFPVLQHLLELAQTHVHWVSDVIQPSHPLLSLFPPTFNLSQHQSLFVNFHIRRCETPGCVWNYWSFSLSVNPSNEYSGLNPLGLTGLVSLQLKGLSRVFPNTTVQKQQFFSTQPSLCSNSHIRTWLLEAP